MPGAARAKAGLGIAGIAGLLALACSARAQAPNLEYSVKANYLVRFAAFVEWPPQAFDSPQAPVTVCVSGRDPFGAVLDRAAAGQAAHGRPVALRRPANAQAVAGCNILYLGEGGLAEAPPMTLTVTDEAVSPRHGMIHFVIAQDRVRFHIDRVAAEAAGVSINSRLLNLALSVRQ